jgi:hypothetical protein
MEQLSRLIIWNHLLFEGTFILLGYSGKYGFKKRSKTPSDTARFLVKIQDFHPTLAESMPQ